MATCKDCFHVKACSGFMPTDLDKDVWEYCQKGVPEQITDIDERCDCFTDRKLWVEVVRCKDCKHWRYMEDGFGDCINPRFHIPGIADHTMEADGFCSCGERITE